MTDARWGLAPTTFEDVVRGRRSVRWFQPRPVPTDIVNNILEAGRWAPSPHGRMPWRFALLDTPEPKKRLADAMGTTWQEQLALDGQDAALIALRRQKAHERVSSAPVAVLLCLYLEDLDHYPDTSRQAAETTMAVQSLGAAAQNMLLAAFALGLDGGWMCAPLFCPEVARDALALPATFVPHALLTFGYAAREPVRRERLPLESLVVRVE